MPTQAKREMIDSLVELLNKSNAVFITEYRGLTVKKISDCRRRIREAGGEEYRRRIADAAGEGEQQGRNQTGQRLAQQNG